MRGVVDTHMAPWRYPPAHVSLHSMRRGLARLTRRRNSHSRTFVTAEAAVKNASKLPKPACGPPLLHPFLFSSAMVCPKCSSGACACASGAKCDVRASSVATSPVTHSIASRACLCATRLREFRLLTARDAARRQRGARDAAAALAKAVWGADAMPAPWRRVFPWSATPRARSAASRATAPPATPPARCGALCTRLARG